LNQVALSKTKEKMAGARATRLWMVAPDRGGCPSWRSRLKKDLAPFCPARSL